MLEVIFMTKLYVIGGENSMKTNEGEDYLRII